MKQKRAEVEARKLMFFGRLLGGAGKRVLPASYADSAEHAEKLYSHPAGAASLMGYALCRRPLTIAHRFKTRDSLTFGTDLVLPDLV